MFRSFSPTQERIWSLLPVSLNPSSCAWAKADRFAQQKLSDWSAISSSMHPSHFRTPRQSPVASAAKIFAATSSRGTGGAHLFLWRFQSAFWHSAPQYEASLQREQRLNPTPCLPQWAQLSALSAIAGAVQQGQKPFHQLRLPFAASPLLPFSQALFRRALCCPFRPCNQPSKFKIDCKNSTTPECLCG